MSQNYVSSLFHRYTLVDPLCFHQRLGTFHDSTKASQLRKTRSWEMLVDFHGKIIRMLCRSVKANTSCSLPVVYAENLTVGSKFLQLHFQSSTSYIYFSKDRPTFMFTGSSDPWPTFRAMQAAACMCLTVALRGSTAPWPPAQVSGESKSDSAY